MSMTVGINGVTFPDGSSQITATQYGMKNRIINGAMVIDQRNAGASVTPANIGAAVYTLDRWAAYGAVVSKFSVQQNAGSITPPVGFTNYLGVTSLSSYTVASGETFVLLQNIEGYNIADLAWGTANAKTVTLSFQVYSSLTGTFGGVLRNSSDSRSYPFSYSISSANTWTSISITIPGDTTGTWLTNTGVGIRVCFGLGVGSSNSGTAGTWVAAGYQSATGTVSVVGTSGATFYITGVQLEKSSTATVFEYRAYGTELALCQRYAFVTDRSTGISGYVTTVNASVSQRLSFPVPMRTAPTITVNTAGSWTVSDDRISDYTASSFSVNSSLSSTQMARLNVAGFTSTPAAGTPLGSMPDQGTGKVLFSAEL